MFSQSNLRFSVTIIRYAVAHMVFRSEDLINVVI
jgi:hypothetical protein